MTARPIDSCGVNGCGTWVSELHDGALPYVYRCHRCELMALYGSASLGTIEYRAPHASRDRIDLVITKATWAAGLWTNAVGSKLDCRSRDALSWRNAHAPLEVASVDATTRSVTVSGVWDDLRWMLPGDVLLVGPRPAVNGPLTRESFLEAGRWAIENPHGTPPPDVLLWGGE